MSKKPICRTCGAELPGPHRPTIFDSYGVGNPGHRMDIPTLSSVSQQPPAGEFNYLDAVGKRDALEIEVDNAYELARTLQDKLNKLNEEIESYEREQSVLDQ